MKKIILSAAAVLLCLSLTACSVQNPFIQSPEKKNSAESSAQAADSTRYHFESIDDQNMIDDSYDFVQLIAGNPQDYGKQCALVQSRLLTLFGEPLYESADFTYSYDYAIRATDDAGNQWYLSVYQGYYGPAIATGSTGEELHDIAYELYGKIMAASLSDFQYEGYDAEVPSKVQMGVADGKAFFMEEELTDPKEIQRMYDILGIDPDYYGSEDPYNL